MIQDHEPIRVTNFEGVFGVDSFEESTPSDHLIDALNFISFGGEIKTRDGFNISDVTPSVRRFFVYRRQGEAARLLILNSSGQIIDQTTGVVILTNVLMTDFSVWFSNGRAYISPHNGVAGLPGEFTYVYNGTGTARKAAGAKPVGTFVATVSGAAGHIESGTHIFAWVYETDTGFTTAPSAAKILVFDGTHAAEFTSIPVGPTGTISRRLIASRAIQSYNGNELGYEMFFVTTGKINNNVDTSLAGVDFYDADLQFSADYTYDQLESIPAVLFISPYGRRMCFGGPDSDKNLIYVSKALEPESIHSSAGFLTCDPFESEGVKDSTEFRDILYITKGSGRTYTTRDNGSEPSTWAGPIRIDQSIGADLNGIATWEDSKGSKADYFCVADKSGLFRFSGIYEDVPVSYKIKNWWDRINRNAFNKLQLLFDQNKFRLYVLVPLDGATTPSHIFVADYSNGFNAKDIKWWIWKFTDFNPSSIAIDKNLSDGESALKVGAITGNIYVQIKDRRNDVSTAIEQYLKFTLIPGSQSTIHHFGGVGMRIRGSGSLGMGLYGIKRVESQVLPNYTLESNPGKDFFQLANFQSERASLELSINTTNGYFQLRQIALFTNVIFQTRPQS